MTDPAKPLSLRFEPISLFTVKQTGWTTFFGGPLAGAWMLRWNYLKLGDPKAASRAFWLGLLGTAAVLALALALPDGFPGLLIGLGYTWAIVAIARKHQGAAIDSHRAESGAICSSWRAVKIALVSVTILLGVAIAAGVGYFALTQPDSLRVGENQHVYYSDGATKGDARLVGDVLIEAEYFEEGAPIDVHLTRPSSEFRLALYFSGDWHHPDNVEFSKWLAGELSRAVGGVPFTIELRDTNESLKNVVPWIPPENRFED